MYIHVQVETTFPSSSTHEAALLSLGFPALKEVRKHKVLQMGSSPNFASSYYFCLYFRNSFIEMRTARNAPSVLSSDFVVSARKINFSAAENAAGYKNLQTKRFCCHVSPFIAVYDL